MFRQSFFICICLFSTPYLFCNGNHIHKRLTSPRKLFSMRPWLASERRGDTFAVADFRYHDYHSNYGTKTIIDMSLRIENWKNQTVKECTYSLEFNESNVFDIKNFERLKGTDEKVVLHWGYHWRYQGAFVMDFRTCFITFFGPKDGDYQLKVVPTDDGGLDLFVKHDTFCKDAGERCMIRYDSSLRVVGRPIPFDVDISWLAMHVERLHNGNLLAHGLDDGFIFYRAILIDSSSGNKTNLLSLDYRSHTWYYIVHSGSSFCWTLKPLVDKTIYCSQFNDKGALNFNSSVKYDVPEQPELVLELADGELVVLGNDMRGSKERNPWNLKWAKTSQSPSETDFGYVQFNCTGVNSNNLQVYDVWRSGERTHLGYACRNGGRYVYDVTSL